MTHSGMNSTILDRITEQAVTRIKVTCLDKKVETKEKHKDYIVYATAFWIRTKGGENVLVTNKHIVFPEMTGAQYKDYKVVKFEVQLREKNENGFGKKTKLFEINLEKIVGRVHISADVAMIINPSFKDVRATNDNVKFGYGPILHSDIADEEFICNKTSMLDGVFFIGYPESWYNHARQSPIARVAYIAWSTKEPFKNDSIKSSHVTLVTGLSFGGNSGSPVIVLPKGISGYEAGDFKRVPAKVIGVLSGHFDDVKYKENTFVMQNSGLAYFTRSSAILEMLDEKNIETISNYIVDQTLLKTYLQEQSVKSESASN